MDTEILRPAVPADLPALHRLFDEIRADMDAKGICIWDEVFPAMHFEPDIAAGRLYVLESADKLCAAFALCRDNDAEVALPWNCGQHPLWLNRLGIHPALQGRGCGLRLLQLAAAEAKSLGADALRLLVVDCNAPAIRLYVRAGFRRVPGVFEDVIDADLTLREFGYELYLD